MEDELHFFQSWWKILRKYWNPPAVTDNSKQANEFWYLLDQECIRLSNTYKANSLFYPFAFKMSLELINEITRRSKELHKKERC